MSNIIRSDSIANIAKALATFQGNCPTIPKGRKNPFFKSTYAGLEDIIETIRKPLSEAGLSYVQLPGNDGLTTILMHGESGESIASTIAINPAKEKDPQSIGSALTYAKRYSLASILGLAVGDEDDDGNSASTPKPKHEAPKKKLTDDQLQRAFTAIDKGEYTTEKLESEYQFTKSQQTELDKYKSKGNAS